MQQGRCAAAAYGVDARPEPAGSMLSGSQVRFVYSTQLDGEQPANIMPATVHLLTFPILCALVAASSGTGLRASSECCCGSSNLAGVLCCCWAPVVRPASHCSHANSPAAAACMPFQDRPAGSALPAPQGRCLATMLRAQSGAPTVRPQSKDAPPTFAVHTNTLAPAPSPPLKGLHQGQARGRRRGRPGRPVCGDRGHGGRVRAERAGRA